MRVEHVCSDSCFASRTADKTRINCLCCDLSFNLKCFGLTATAFVNKLMSDSNAVFLCSKCCDRVSKLKKNRSSIDTCPNQSTAPSMDSNSVPIQEAQSSILPKIMVIFETINDKLIKIDNDHSNNKSAADSEPPKNDSPNGNNNNTHHQQLYESMMNLHAKLD